MEDSIIEKAAKDYITNQLDQNPDWLRCITDSWIYDAENWFLDMLEKQYGMKIFEEDNGEYDEYTPEVNSIVEKFWGFVQKEKDKKYEELYGERDAFCALPGMIRYIKEVQQSFDSVKEHYVQDSPTREGHCNHVLELLQQAIYEMEDLRIKSKERR